MSEVPTWRKGCPTCEARVCAECGATDVDLGWAHVCEPCWNHILSSSWIDDISRHAERSDV